MTQEPPPSLADYEQALTGCLAEMAAEAGIPPDLIPPRGPRWVLEDDPAWQQRAQWWGEAWAAVFRLAARAAAEGQQAEAPPGRASGPLPEQGPTG